MRDGFGGDDGELISPSIRPSRHHPPFVGGGCVVAVCVVSRGPAVGGCKPCPHLGLPAGWCVVLP